MRSYFLAAVAAAALAPSANAATISFSDGFGPAVTNWSETLSLSQFDPSLGTLTSVTFELFGTAEGVANAESLSNGPSNVTLNLGAEVEASLAGFGSLGQVIPLASQTIALSAFDGNIDFGGTSGVALDDLEADDEVSNVFVSGLAPFIGTGNLPVIISASGNSSGSGSGNLITQFFTDAFASATITYDYDEIPDEVPPIPLPAAAWMLLAALGSLVAVRRYKQG